ncbi:hypothetical protein Plhal710r2_c017g0075191 [Plasmopara halstedii]
MRTIPIGLARDEIATYDIELFERWVQRHQNLSSLVNLQLSHREVDTRVERIFGSSLPNSKLVADFLRIVALRYGLIPRTPCAL